MANEASLHIEYSPPIAMTAVNATAIEKGTALTLSDPFTAGIATDSTAACAGIAAEEKIASDGKTKVSVYRDGIFKVTASGAVTVGQAVAFQDNYACMCIADHAHFAGYALETVTDTQEFLMELRPGHHDT